MNVLDCRNPHMPFTEFYNEVLSDAVEMDKDFANYKSNEDFSSHHGKFSFMKFAFILTPATKTLGLYYDNRWAIAGLLKCDLCLSIIVQHHSNFIFL